MASVITKEGIVGFFDILGYTSFLENNRAEDAAAVIVNILTKLHENIPELADSLYEHTKDEFKKPIERVEWLVFSDTILVVLPWSDAETDRFRFDEWVAFTMIAQVLSRTMFEFGLPLRGAITVGDFVLEGSCFAGKSIIEAYHLAQSLEFAATALSHRAADDMTELFKKNGYTWSHLFQTYLAPKKNGASEKHLILSPTPCVWPIVGDLRQLTAEAFWRHNKDVPPEVFPKIMNTEMYFRYVKMVHSHIFEETEKSPPKRKRKAKK